MILGKQLLGLADCIDPGMTKWRGQLLLDLQSSSTILTKRAFQEDRVTKEQAKVRISSRKFVTLVRVSMKAGFHEKMRWLPGAPGMD